MASTDSVLSTTEPIVLLFSGKRKSGKDHVTELLKERLGDRAVIIRLSGPLKECYAKEKGLDFQRMLSAGEYKEQHRLAMITWSEEIRDKDYTYFCRQAIDKYCAPKYPVWIVSDCRRETDLRYFAEQFPTRVRKVRIVAEEEVRRERGWVFTPQVDDMESECGLDRVESWDLVIDNSGGSLDPALAALVSVAGGDVISGDVSLTGGDVVKA